jgi:hypothetical protein
MEKVVRVMKALDACNVVESEAYYDGLEILLWRRTEHYGLSTNNELFRIFQSIHLVMKSY